MKKFIGTIFSLFLASGITGQNIAADSKPKGMEFVPQGSFQMKMSVDSEPKVYNVTVSAFWMSNEITNAEFREFVEWAKKNPGEKLYQVDYSQATITDPKKGITKDTIIRQIIPIEVSKISSGMIDPLCLEKANREYKDYFYSEKYNDYPVVGVSFKIARYYCIWRTTIENQRLREQGLPEVHMYRIPLETEWEYAARQSDNESGTPASGNIQKVNEGSKNEWGLNHLDDNVSEWVTSNKGENGIVRGGSWKSGSSISDRQKKDINTGESYIGFRIVQSYLQK